MFGEGKRDLARPMKISRLKALYVKNLSESKGNSNFAE